MTSRLELAWAALAAAQAELAAASKESPWRTVYSVVGFDEVPTVTSRQVELYRPSQQPDVSKGFNFKSATGLVYLASAEPSSDYTWFTTAEAAVQSKVAWVDEQLEIYQGRLDRYGGIKVRLLKLLEGLKPPQES